MFNDLQVKHLKPKSTPYKVYEKGSDKGFHIQVSPSGKRVFYIAYTLNGKKRFYNLGAYSTKFTVKLAREACRTAQLLLNNGLDPQLEHKKTEQAQDLERLEQAKEDEAVTVNDVLDYYLITLSNPNTLKNVRLQFKSDVRPFIGQIKAHQLTDEEVEAIIRKVVLRGAIRSARNLYIALNAAFNKARKNYDLGLKGWTNPLNDVEKPPEGDPNDRALTIHEVKQFWNELESYDGMSQGLKDTLQILLLTGQRVKDILELRWTEVNLDEKYIDLPPERTKSGKKTRRGHIIPLTPKVVEILNRQVRAGLAVFPGNRGFDVPLHWQSLTKALSTMVKSSEKIEHFSPRDIRGTVKTHMARIRIMKEVRDRIQNHALHDVASKHYDRHDYFDEKYGGLFRWEKELLSIVENGTFEDLIKDEKVVPIKKNPDKKVGRDSWK